MLIESCNRSRIFVSILLGACAGILGLENLWGAIFYLVGSVAGVGLFLALKVGLGKGSLYYSNWTEIFTSSLSTNLFVRLSSNSHRMFLSHIANKSLFEDVCDGMDSVLRYRSCLCVDSGQNVPINAE